MTPADFRRLADQADAESLQLALKGDFFKAADKALEAERLRYTADQLEARLKRTHLHPPGQVSTLPKVEAIERSRGAAISAAKTTANTLFQQHLKDRGLSIPEWVASKGKGGPSVEQARSWCKPKGKGGRAVPAAWANKLAREFGDPRLTQPESWPAGIR